LLKKAVRPPTLAASQLEEVAEEAAALRGEGIEEGWGGCGDPGLWPFLLANETVWPRARHAMVLPHCVLFWLTVNQQNDADELYMRAALDEARAAAERGEVPVGATVVIGERIVARAGNRTIADCDPTAHAEIVALREAARAIGNYRLAEATVYVTIEPCAMCAGAMIQARIARLVYGADDVKGGAVRSCFSVFDHPQLNHRAAVSGGVLAGESALLLREFFAARR
jgi:tRNA(adenine34) deaminase